MRNCFPTPKALTPAEDAKYPNLSKVPSRYHWLTKVFSKAQAISFPLHPPLTVLLSFFQELLRIRGRLYSLSRPETLAMRKYIDESLAAGITRPSSSPVGKDFSLWTKEISLYENRYPLPLITSAFKSYKKPSGSPI